MFQVQQKGIFWGKVLNNKWHGAKFVIDDFHASRIKQDGTSNFFIFNFNWLNLITEAHSSEYAVKMADVDNREKNNSSAAELEHKWQKKFHSICVLMGAEYAHLFLYNYGLFQIEHREVQLHKKGKLNELKYWKNVGTW